MKLKTIIILGAVIVGSSALFGVRLNAQTNHDINFTTIELTNSWATTNTMDGSLIAADGHYLIPPQRTALSAKISGEVVTNWTTTSITSQVVPESERYYAVFRPDLLNQSGVIKSNTLATIQWNGKPVTVIIETVQIGTTTRTTWKNAPQ